MEHGCSCPSNRRRVIPVAASSISLYKSRKALAVSVLWSVVPSLVWLAVSYHLPVVRSLTCKSAQMFSGLSQVICLQKCVDIRRQSHRTARLVKAMAVAVYFSEMTDTQQCTGPRHVIGCRPIRARLEAFGIIRDHVGPYVLEAE
jgi:hypothetical protein